MVHEQGARGQPRAAGVGVCGIQAQNACGATPSRATTGRSIDDETAGTSRLGNDPRNGRNCEGGVVTHMDGRVIGENDWTREIGHGTIRVR